MANNRLGKPLLLTVESKEIILSKGYWVPHRGREDIALRRVRLLFVTDPYNQQENAQRDRFNRSTKMDVLLALNSGHPFYFDGRRLGLEHHYTDPLIRAC